MSWILEPTPSPLNGLTLRLTTVPGVRLESSTEQFVISHPWGALRLGAVRPEFGDALRVLQSGWVGREELPALTPSPALAAELLWMLDQWAFLFRLQLADGLRPLIEIEPLSATASLTFGGPLPQTTEISPFAYVRRVGGRLVMESAVAEHRIVFENAEQLASALQGEADISNAAWLPLLLARTGMLNRAEHPGGVGISEGLLEISEFHDLLFHRRSRFGHHDDAFGGTFPFLSERRPEPALPPRTAPAIELPAPQREAVAAADLSLTEAMEQRMSSREFSDAPLGAQMLGEFLFRVARVKGVYGPIPEAGLPYEVSERPYPSGGGAYDVEIYLAAHNVADLRRGVYRYVPQSHELALLDDASDIDLTGLLTSAQSASGAARFPPALFLLTSRFGRLAWKYRSISYAVTLKNVGVLYQTMYLVATAMGLAACALGSGNNAIASRAMRLAERGELPVGEFMIGTPLPVSNKDQRWQRAHPSWRPLIGAEWNAAWRANETISSAVGHTSPTGASIPEQASLPRCDRE